MIFEEKLQVNKQAVLNMMGYNQKKPDKQTASKLDFCVQELLQTAVPRWVYKVFMLENGHVLQPHGVVLQGENIGEHLKNCTHCVVLCASLGQQTDKLINMLEVQDMASAVLMDAAASVLIEEYANEAENIIAQKYKDNKFLTSRFSPGYGDFDIGIQKKILQIIDAERMIGLSVSQSGIMLPRKSITALIGLAAVPVQGKLASCENCALRAKCEKENGGEPLCGNF